MQIVSPITSGGCLSMQYERRDGISDGVIEQAVKRSKFAQGDWRVHFDRQLSDDLANVAVTMDYLTYGVPLLEQLVAVGVRRAGTFYQSRRVLAPRFGVRLLMTERVNELFQESWNPVF